MVSSFTITDTGHSFYSYWENKTVEFPYGYLSLSLIDMDADALKGFIISRAKDISGFKKYSNHLIETFKNGKYSNGRIKPSQLSKRAASISDCIADTEADLLYSFFKDIVDLLDNSYLNPDQLSVLSMAITVELANNIEQYDSDPADSIHNIPYILRSSKMRDQIKAILLDTSLYFTDECLKYVNSHRMNFTIQNTNDGVQKVYHLEDFTSLFVLDIQQLITNRIAVRECKNPKCRRLFIPSSGKNKTYCTLPHRGTSKTCAQLVHDNPSNRFAALAKYARGKQKGFYSNATGEYSRPTSKIPKYIYDRKKIDQLYSDWQDELSNEAISPGQSPRIPQGYPIR